MRVFQSDQPIEGHARWPATTITEQRKSDHNRYLESRETIMTTPVNARPQIAAQNCKKGSRRSTAQVRRTSERNPENGKSVLKNDSRGTIY
jgi:hypothetical protein